MNKNLLCCIILQVILLVAIILYKFDVFKNNICYFVFLSIFVANAIIMTILSHQARNSRKKIE